MVGGGGGEVNVHISEFTHLTTELKNNSIAEHHILYEHLPRLIMKAHYTTDQVKLWLGARRTLETGEGREVRTEEIFRGVATMTSPIFLTDMVKKRF